MVLKDRGLVTESGDPTPDGAALILKGLTEGKLDPEDILSEDELEWAQTAVQKSRPFIKAFGAIRPPGRPR